MHKNRKNASGFKWVATVVIETSKNKQIMKKFKSALYPYRLQKVLFHYPSLLDYKNSGEIQNIAQNNRLSKICNAILENYIMFKESQ